MRKKKKKKKKKQKTSGNEKGRSRTIIRAAEKDNKNIVTLTTQTRNHAFDPDDAKYRRERAAKKATLPTDSPYIEKHKQY